VNAQPLARFGFVHESIMACVFAPNLVCSPSGQSPINIATSGTVEAVPSELFAPFSERPSSVTSNMALAILIMILFVLVVVSRLVQFFHASVLTNAPESTQRCSTAQYQRGEMSRQWRVLAESFHSSTTNRGARSTRGSLFAGSWVLLVGIWRVALEAQYNSDLEHTLSPRFRTAT